MVCSGSEQNSYSQKIVWKQIFYSSFIQRLTDWKSVGRPNAKGPKFISVALEKYFHGRDGIVCVFVPALSICLIVLAALTLQTGDKLPLVFRPRSGGGRVSWMLMRALPDNFWAFHLKIATILSGSGDSSYLRWPAKDRNIWGRCWHGVTDGFSDLCLFIWYKSSYDDLRWEDTEVMTGAHPQHTCVEKFGVLSPSND